MDSQETLSFARKLMREFWEPYDSEAVSRYYHRGMVGHHREQRLTFDDVVHRLGTDRTRYADSTYDIRDIVADEDKFTIRFIYTALVNTTRQTFTTEVTYFYQLKEGKIAEFWLLSDTDFDYKADD